MELTSIFIIVIGCFFLVVIFGLLFKRNGQSNSSFSMRESFLRRLNSVGVEDS
jgi:hypothetical protein